MQSGMNEPCECPPPADGIEAGLAPSVTGTSEPETTSHDEQHKPEYWTQCLGCFTWTCIPLAINEVTCANEACRLQVVRLLNKTSPC